MKLRESIEQVWQNRELLTQQSFQNDVRTVMEEVDKGRLRVAEPGENGWVVNEWVNENLGRGAI
jgi:2,3,4,5-tetrahydropyridine-2,6-dicarboxylate N-succinyltransferase